MEAARRRLALAVALGAALAAGRAGAEGVGYRNLDGQVVGALYRYVDPSGVIHFTDHPDHAGFVAVGRREAPAARVVRAYDNLISRQAGRHAVPAALVKAVIAAESNFDPRAVSPKGARGLMQLMPETARALGVSDPFRAEDNVAGGTRYLSRLLSRYGDWSRALAAYNAGPEAVDRYQGVPPFPETLRYVERVLAYYRQYDAEFAR